MSDPAVKLQEKIDKSEDMFVELGGFKEGKNKPFNFYYPQGKSLSGLVRHFDVITKGKGEETVLMLANNNVAFRFRGRANSQIVEEADRVKALQENKTLLISPEEAMQYEPGAREVNSEAGLVRAKTEALKNAAKAKASGDIVAYAAYVEEVIRLRKQLDDAIAASMADLQIPTATAA